ncbi:hypothetical protein [Chthonobacter albigriseus]|uniref:hypothetical protein n=1 Tax=Chthonobacter albigriseus TaxID=1683161 RepID=UPI0015EF6423|nr:hypothetical protein [Chthonobacter albigriseus]
MPDFAELHTGNRIREAAVRPDAPAEAPNLPSIQVVPRSRRQAPLSFHTIKDSQKDASTAVGEIMQIRNIVCFDLKLHWEILRRKAEEDFSTLLKIAIIGGVPTSREHGRMGVRPSCNFRFQ